MTANHPRSRKQDPSESIDRRTVLRGALSTGVAAAGLGAATGGATAQELPNTVSLRALSPRIEYRIIVSEELELGPLAGESDELRGGDGGPPTIVVGQADEGSTDDFRYRGEITSLELARGNAEVQVDGEQTTLREIMGVDQISIEAQEQTVEYQFSVDGEVRGGYKADTDRLDSIEDGNVTGVVSGTGVDNYLFDGEVSEFQVSNENVIVRANGEEADLSQ